jgi:hypothetical protein
MVFPRVATIYFRAAFLKKRGPMAILDIFQN